MRLAITLCALLAVLPNSPARAAPLAPTGKWVMDFGDTQCVAARNYGSEAKPLMLVLKQPTLGQIVQLAVIRKGGGNSKHARQINGKIRIDNGPPIKASMIVFAAQARGESIISMNMPLAQFAAVRKGQTLSFSTEEVDETFQLTSIGPLMKIMDECVTDLTRLWNGDAAASVRLKQLAKGDLQTIFSSDDYPDAAMTLNKTGWVSFVVLVNEQGRFADCTVIETSGVAALDAQSCAVVVERARFKPAIGIDGSPVKSILRQRIVWAMAN